MALSPLPDDNVRRPLLDGCAGVVFTVLLVAAALMMLWTWTGHTAFAVATCCTVAGVFAAGFVWARTGWTELVGGPLDGARIRPAGIARRRGADLVLALPGGGRARYGPDGTGRLVYRGRAGDGDR
ncbi:hypothetical protein [Nocardiopsis sp. FR26]|uniref:hypothetical protein n=1 Tax=Nocardiopsis sp. FR26 TaxID=2605987 RepID=UPI00135C88CF|nr:hypothetical protein [Nocardiopsis sp. FR26]